MSNHISRTWIDLDSLEIAAPSPESEALRAEVAGLLGELAAHLTEAQQRILEYRYSLDMTFDEIATQLKVTDAAIHGMHGRALNAMRRKLAERNIRRSQNIV